MKERAVKSIATFFGLGFFPYAPGTAASFAALIIIFFLQDNPAGYYAGLGLVLALGFICSGRAEAVFRQKDPGTIVIDEVAGMFVCFLFIKISILNLLLGFFLFRIFDITKPFPANIAQKAKGSVGIMLDDIIAGIYANLVLRLVVMFIGRL